MRYTFNDPTYLLCNNKSQQPNRCVVSAHHLLRHSLHNNNNNNNFGDCLQNRNRQRRRFSFLSRSRVHQLVFSGKMIRSRRRDTRRSVLSCPALDPPVISSYSYSSFTTYNSGIPIRSFLSSIRRSTTSTPDRIQHIELCMRCVRVYGSEDSEDEPKKLFLFALRLNNH